MGIEEPKQYTPEEMAEMQKSRTISDAELLKGGAEYVVGENEEKRLELTEDQVISILKGKDSPESVDTKESVTGQKFKIYQVSFFSPVDGKRKTELHKVGEVSNSTGYGRRSHEIEEFFKVAHRPNQLLIVTEATADGGEVLSFVKRPNGTWQHGFAENRHGSYSLFSKFGSPESLEELNEQAKFSGIELGDA